MRFAVDTGGTFTDLVLEDEDGGLRMFKAPTTPGDPVDGIMAALAQAAESLALSTAELLAGGQTFIHGTTHAINAVITGRTAKTAFLTTAGHPDVLVLREGGRTEPFNFAVPFPEPYVPRALTFEIAERIAADGEVIEPLAEDAVIELFPRLSSLGVESIAVCLLWSTVNPVHEGRIGELLDEHLPGVPYTLSHVLNPILREYRRASSTAIDASLKPLMSSYVNGLAERLEGAGWSGRLLMLTSGGGVIDAEEMARAPVHAIGSGPSMAPIAGRHYARADADADTAIVADTGGTTFDISLVRRDAIPMTPETWLGGRYRGHIVGFPAVDVRSIGSGGGSIAWVDDGGLLHVGPASAGAVPGPACYGKGGERATVTDAALVLGYIDPAFFLGGSLPLDLDRAVAAVELDVGSPLGLDRREAAAAILRLATENMVGAIEEITINQGIDPRGAVLVGGGGAAGLNSVAIARRLGCTSVVIPELGAALSATGALMSDLQADHRALRYAASDNFDYDGVNEVLEALTSRCEEFIRGPGGEGIDHSIDLYAEARYRHQIWEIDLPLGLRRFRSAEDLAGVREDFDRLHEEVFAFRDPGSDVEFVGWRATARSRLRHAAFGQLRSAGGAHPPVASSRSTYFSGHGPIETTVALFEAMKPRSVIAGPAIIESPFTTVVVDPGAQATRKGSGTLVIVP